MALSENQQNQTELCVGGYVDPASYFSEVMGVKTCSRPVDAEAGTRKRKWECNDAEVSLQNDHGELCVPSSSDGERGTKRRCTEDEPHNSGTDGSECEREPDTHFTAQCLLRQYQREHVSALSAHNRFKHKKKMEAQLLEEIATIKTEESERLAHRVQRLEAEVNKLRQQVFFTAFVKTMQYYQTVAGQSNPTSADSTGIKEVVNQEPATAN